MCFAKTSPTLLVTIQPGCHDALGTFTITNSASQVLQSLCSSYRETPIRKPRRQRPELVLDLMFDVKSSRSSRTPSSPLSSVGSATTSIPSLIRGLSDSDQPSSMSSPTTLCETPQMEAPKFDSVFAKIETQSKLCSRDVVCVTCRKPGVNYPKCSRCGDMWCSRECRLFGGAKKHLCSKPTR